MYTHYHYILTASEFISQDPPLQSCMMWPSLISRLKPPCSCAKCRNVGSTRLVMIPSVGTMFYEFEFNQCLSMANLATCANSSPYIGNWLEKVLYNNLRYNTAWPVKCLLTQHKGVPSLSSWSTSDISMHWPTSPLGNSGKMIVELCNDLSRFNSSRRGSGCQTLNICESGTHM